MLDCRLKLLTIHDNPAAKLVKTPNKVSWKSHQLTNNSNSNTSSHNNLSFTHQSCKTYLLHNNNSFSQGMLSHLTNYADHPILICLSRYLHNSSSRRTNHHHPQRWFSKVTQRGKKVMRVTEVYQKIQMNSGGCMHSVSSLMLMRYSIHTGKPLKRTKDITLAAIISVWTVWTNQSSRKYILQRHNNTSNYSCNYSIKQNKTNSSNN